MERIPQSPVAQLPGDVYNNTNLVNSFLGKDNMSTNQHSLRQAIVDNPDDDMVRLIYADFLEENHDARAELIRVQCESADLAEYDPRRYELVMRARQLLLPNRTKWRSEDLAGRKMNCEFAGGFVHAISLSATTFIREAEELLGLSPIQKVNLYETRHVVPELANCRALAGVRHLNLSGRGNQIGVTGLRELLKSPHLSGLRELGLARENLRAEAMRELCHSKVISQIEWLDLTDNRIDVAGLKHLAGCPSLSQLRYLDLSQCRLGDSAMHFLLFDTNNLRQLQTLKLSSTDLTETGIRSYSRSAQPLNLKHLDLSWNAIGNEGATALAISKQSSSLETLNLTQCGVREVGFRRLCESKHLRNLRVLDLGGNEIAGPALKPLTNTEGLSGLHLLRLSGSSIEDEGAEFLANSPQLDHLRSLALINCAIGPWGVKALVSSEHLSNLVELVFNGTEIGDQAMQAVAAFPQLSSLRRLWLNAAGITDSGLEALAGSKHLPSLNELTLCETDVSLNGLLTLMDSPIGARLVRLVLGPDTLDEQEMEQLKNHPNGKKLDVVIYSDKVSVVFQ